MTARRTRSIVSRQRMDAQGERVKRGYTMTEAALAQRRAAQPKALAAGALAGKATGPITEEGKAAVSRNGWKHGRASAANLQRFGRGASSLSAMFSKPAARPARGTPKTPTARTSRAVSSSTDSRMPAAAASTSRSTSPRSTR